MNAAPPVSQAQPSIDAVQPEAPASSASASARTGNQDFAAALNDAGCKPARKNAAYKQQDPVSSGSSLPSPGNQPPVALPPLPPPANTDASTSATADAAAIAKASKADAQGPQPVANFAPPTAPANAGGAATILAAANLDLAAPPVAPDPAADDVATTEPLDGTSSIPGSGPAMPHAVGIRTLASPGTSAVAPPQLPRGIAREAQSGSATRPGTTAAASSGPSSSDATENDSTLNNGSSGAADATAQSVMAAAAAVAQGASAPTPESSDASISQGAATPSDPAAGAPAAAFARAAAASVAAAASAAAASTAAAATAIVQAVSDAAGSSAADKRSHGQSPDSILAGASNDGSVGAAQLLTSNTSTDNAATPTFKVAAGVDTAQFGQGVADRVSLMMDGNLTSAKLQVNPPALGPIEVRIALQGGHAQVWLSSHSAVTRDALEASSPKLQEMLGSQGFSQVSVDISQRSFQERSPQSQAYESAPGGDTPIPTQASLSISRSASGLLDAYA
jgi:flagellar hook-length control protein FliK